MKAIDYGSVTMVGYGGSFPRGKGNCFSLRVKNLKNGYTRIANFGYENLQELFRRKIVEWPIEVEILSEKIGIIVDERIPKEWYSEHWCDVCCPRELMPEYEQWYYNKWDRLFQVVSDGTARYYPGGIKITDKQREELKMGYQQRRYKAEIETIIKDALSDYMIFDSPQIEKEFKTWLFERKQYYLNRFANTIIPKKPANKLEVINLVKEEVDKLLETYEQEKTK